MMQVLNEQNVLRFFANRPRGVRPELIADTAGLETPEASELITRLVTNGALVMRDGLYFVSEPA